MFGFFVYVILMIVYCYRIPQKPLETYAFTVNPEIIIQEIIPKALVEKAFNN